MTYLVTIAVLVGIVVNHAIWLLFSQKGAIIRIVIALPLVASSYVAAVWMLGEILSHGGIGQGSLWDWGILISIAAAITFAYQIALGRRNKSK